MCTKLFSPKIIHLYLGTKLCLFIGNCFVFTSHWHGHHIIHCVEWQNKASFVIRIFVFDCAFYLCWIAGIVWRTGVRFEASMGMYHKWWYVWCCSSYQTLYGTCFTTLYFDSSCVRSDSGLVLQHHLIYMYLCSPCCL